MNSSIQQRRRFGFDVALAILRGPLRRAQISFAAMWTGESALLVALAVAAYQDGGVAAVGLITAARMAAAAVLTPLLAALADRVRRERVLTGIGVVRAVTLTVAAVEQATGGPVVATYICVVITTIALGLYRPAHSALLPALANSPADLTSANAVRGLLDSLSILGGPVIGAALLAIGDPALVFAACAALSLLGALVVTALPYDPPPRAAAARTSVGRDVVAGFATIVHDRTLALVTTLGLVQTFTRGCLTVFTVVIAIDLLDTGYSGVGLVNSVIGAGGLIGSVSLFALLRRGGLGSWFGIGVAGFGAPLALIGAIPWSLTTVIGLALIGAGNAITDVAGFTVLARFTDETVLARMFAGFEAILTLGVAAGGLIAPLLIHAFGVRNALVVIGLLAPVAVGVSGPALRRLDGRMRVRDSDIAILRSVPMLGALPATTIEQLSAELRYADFAPGQAVFVQDDAGDGFYVVQSGRAEVVRHGNLVNTLAHGEGFGEIALLDNRPRTATVRAADDHALRVAVLSRSAFLTAVTGYPISASAGREVVARIKARDDSAGDSGRVDGVA